MITPKNRTSDRAALTVPVQEDQTLFSVADLSESALADQSQYIDFVNLRESIVLSAFGQKLSLSLSSQASTLTPVVPDTVLNGGIAVSKSTGYFTLPTVGQYRCRVGIQGATPSLLSGLQIEIAIIRVSSGVKLDSFVWNSPGDTVTDAPYIFASLSFKTLVELTDQYYIGVRQLSGSTYVFDKINIDMSYLGDITIVPPAWVETSPLGAEDAKWLDCCCDDSGYIMYAINFQHLVYRSIDRGETWAAVSPLSNGNYYTICCSGDGQTVFTAVYTGRAYISYNGGGTWAENGPDPGVNHIWFCSDMSKNGLVILLGDQNYRLWVTIDGGANWTETRPAGDVDKGWQSCAVSGDGLSYLAGTAAGNVYRYSSSSWSTLTSLSGAVGCMALNYTGSLGLWGGYDGRLWLTSDSFANIAEVRPAGNANRYWYGCSCNWSGAVILVGAYSGLIYQSLDYGATWAATGPTPASVQGWAGNAVNISGTVMIAGELVGRLWIYR